MNQPLTNKVLLIGWDAADWKVITPLIDAGKMPNLKRFLDRGVMGNLATLYPILSPMLWTSIGTGKRAYKHGVHGFIEPDPTSGNVRPISNLARKTKAIWNILNQEGKRCNVIGWWPTEPVEPINGVMVSNHYQQAPPNYKAPWPIKKQAIHPPHLIESLAEYRIRPSEIEAEQLLLFVPDAAKVDQEKDKRLGSIAKIIAETASIHAAATATMQLEEWDFMAIYYDAIDHFGHGFMKYHPPKSPWIKDEDFELYSGVIEACYRYHDLMLGVLMQLAGEDTNIIICSDHGFHPDRLRPQYIPNEPAGPAEEHRPYGIIAMNGPDIKKDELVYGATLLDITPTILTLFGLPVGRDMDGKPLITALEDSPQVEFIDSWDEVEGDCAMHPPDMLIDSVDSQAAMEQLVELGYVEELNDDKEQRVQETVRELRYNLARSYIGANRYREAMPILEELWDQWPTESRFGVKLFNSCVQTNQIAKARETLEKSLERKEEYANQAREELKQLSEQLKAKKPEEITDSQRHKLRKLQARANVNMPTLAYLQGSLLFAEGKYPEALEFLEKAKTTQTHNLPSLYQKIGEVYLRQRKWAEAESYFLQVLEIDPVNPSGLFGLCRVYLKQQRNQEALEKAIATLGLDYHNPQGHFYCGVALHRNGKIEEAEQELLTALNQNPVFPQVHRRLALLYTKDKLNLEKATTHRRLAKEAMQRIRDFKAGNIPVTETRQKVFDWYERSAYQRQQINSQPTTPISESVVIVSGLPRSGTSMMMQILGQGGLPIFTDNARKADESNVKGYYEFEKAKQLATDNSWVKDIKGKGVKIVAQLLPNLPAHIPYRIIFMERHLKEVIASQKKMLMRLNRKASKLKDEQLAQTYLQQLANVEKLMTSQDNIDILFMNFEEVINNPTSCCTRVNQFLGGSFDEVEMQKAIAPELRHQIVDNYVKN